MMKLGK